MTLRELWLLCNGWYLWTFTDHIGNYLEKKWKKTKLLQIATCCQMNNVSRLMHSFCVSLGFHCRFPICPLNQVDVILTWPPAGALWASRVGFNSFWQANQRERWRGTINGRSLLITGQVDSSEAEVKTRLRATCDSLIANEAWENVTDSEPEAHAERGNENTVTST